MRLISTLLVGTALVSTGCSSLIARRGLDLESLKTHDQIIAQFGPPTVGVAPGGVPCEVFRPKQKIAEQTRAEWLTTGFEKSYGLQEVAVFPHEVYLLARRSLIGQKVCITYTPLGTVNNIYIDGQLYTPLRKDTGGTVVPAAATVKP